MWGVGEMPSRACGDPFGYSFVIPTLGRSGTLKRVLRQITEVVDAPFDVVVVFDGHDVQIERELLDAMKVLPRGVGTFIPLGSHQGVAHARNAGIARAPFRFCVFLDDDVELTDQWWAAVCEHISSGHVCLTGPILTHEQSVLARARALRYEARYESLRTGDVTGFLAGGNSIVPRADLVALGGFPRVRVGSDSLLIEGLRSRRIDCVFVHEMAVYHQHDRGTWRAVSNAFGAGQTAGSIQAIRPDARQWWLTARRLGDVPVVVLNAGLLVVKILGILNRERRSR